MIAEYVVRCDYCGQYVVWYRAVRSARVDGELDDGSKVVLPAIYCGDYCATRGTSPFGSSRG